MGGRWLRLPGVKRGEGTRTPPGAPRHPGGPAAVPRGAEGAGQAAGRAVPDPAGRPGQERLSLDLPAIGGCRGGGGGTGGVW